MIPTEPRELDRLADVVRREASFQHANARASLVVGGEFEITLTQEKFTKARDLKRAGEILEELARLGRRAHLRAV